MLGFVDNKRNYVNNTLFVSTNILITAMERSVNSWNELLHFSRGDLELRKCAKRAFNNKDNPMLETHREYLFIKNNGAKITSRQLDPASPITYLGVTAQPSGIQTAQLKKITDISKD